MTTPLPPLRPSDPPEVEERLWHGFTGKLAFDVGARMGENVAMLYRKNFSEVICLEPEPRSFAALAERYGHLALDDAFCVRLMPVAVSSATGDVELAQVPAAMSKGELVTPGLRGMEWEPADWDAVPRVSVPATTLDTLMVTFGCPELVIIDTEGHELEILRGATEVLAKGQTDFLIEFHAPQLHAGCGAFLRDAGYDQETVRHPHYAPSSAMWFQHGWLRAFAPRRSATAK